jgi:hypothetical protein
MAEDDKNGTAKTWLKRLKDAEEREYHQIVDDIDDRYAKLTTLAATTKDREYRLFWANMGVLLPTLYSRPPIPVATSRFQDRKELPRRTADLLERALIADVDTDKYHDTMQLTRDDLGIGARGVQWIRLVDRNGLEVPSAIHVHRRDFRCDRARYWHEVTWVSKQAWLTKERVKKRFGKVAEGMVFQEDKPEKNDDTKGPAKAAIWEIWDKTGEKVHFVSEGVKDIIESVAPPLDLEDFFPCPRPAMGTVQRGTLTAVPDYVYYRDQLSEINELTARIGGLQKALRLKGFYAAGNEGIGEAVEGIMRRVDNEAIMVPVSSFAMGAAKAGDAVLWLPLDMVASTLQACVELRRQYIEDVYEITGISDIMRGQTDATETLGAQQLKSQFGSVRIRERQGELVRIARDVIRMKAEIMAENVPIADLLTMAQVDDLPSEQDIKQQVEQVQQQAEQQIAQIVQQSMQAPPPGMPPQGQPQGAPM